MTPPVAGTGSAETAPVPHGRLWTGSRTGRRRRDAFETLIRTLLAACALATVLITLTIIILLIRQSVVFFEQVPFTDFAFGTVWTALFADPQFGILPLLAGSLGVTCIACLVGIPVGTLVALWLSEYAGPRWRDVLKPAIELLASVPSVVFGYFALRTVTPLLQPILRDWFGIELPTFNMLSAGLVMGVMIIPYVASICDDSFRAIPDSLREASLAAGATRAQMAFGVILPAAASGVLAAYILAVSRAIGETMIVTVAAGSRANLTADPTQPVQTITSFIAQAYTGDVAHGSLAYYSIFAAGTALFLFTFVMNLLGQFIRTRALRF